MARKKEDRIQELYVVEGTFWFGDENERHPFCLPILATSFSEAHDRGYKLGKEFGIGLFDIRSVKKGSTL